MDTRTCIPPKAVAFGLRRTRRISFRSFIIIRLAEGRGVAGTPSGAEEDIERCSDLKYVLDLRALVDRLGDLDVLQRITCIAIAGMCWNVTVYI